MKIHREGKRILLVVPIVLFLLYYFLNKKLILSYVQSCWFLGISSALYLWLIYFFRDPYRIIYAREQVVLVPADGKVIDIQRIYEDEFLGKDRIKVSIFMSPLNVHVNRTPIAGTIKYFKYHPGKYLVAFHPKSSKKNERTTIVIENNEGEQVLFRQIAGFVARRIKFYFQEGDAVEQGIECGFIKFGSRADVYLPLDADIEVEVGDKVKGGITVLAKI